MCASVRKRKSQSPKRTNRRKRMEKKRRKKSLQLKKNLLRMNFEAQNMLSDSVFYDAAGCGIGRLDTYLVILALRKLGDDPKAGIESVRFFGKFFGISK